MIAMVENETDINKTSIVEDPKDKSDDHEMNHDHLDHSTMDHSSMDHSSMDHSSMDHSGMNHSSMDHSGMDHSGMDHSGMDHSGMDHSSMDHDHHDHHAHMVADFKKRFYISLVIIIPILILSPTIQGFLGLDLHFTGDSYLLFGLSTVLFFYGGKPFLTGAKDELKAKSPGMMTLIAFAISISYLYSSLTVFVLSGMDFFWELGTLIMIMLLGHWIEMKSVMGASKALDEMVKLMPEIAHLLKDDGNVMDVPVKQLQVNDLILVRPGEKVPMDGVVVVGVSQIDESMISGESVPVEKIKDDEVIGGSINAQGGLTIRVTRTGGDTYLSQVIRLVKDAQESKSKTQRLADKAAKYLFYIALASGILTALVWSVLGKEYNFVIERAVTVIVICCPHALGLAMPLVTAVSTSLAAKNGLLIRNRAVFENARNLNAVIFDKTGTLTEGKFGVDEIVAIGIEKERLQELVYSVELNSEHPIAKGIVKSFAPLNLNVLDVQNYQAKSGEGLVAKVNSQDLIIVGPRYLRTNNIPFDENAYTNFATKGKTVIFVLLEGKLVGYLALSDIIKETSKPAIAQLQDMGIKSIMLTGDNANVAHTVGEQIGIREVIAEVLPHEKADKVKAVHQSGSIVAMVGDGINDAPSLAQADLGVAIGVGSDVAIETADVILVKSNPQDVVNIIRLSRKVYTKMIQNLVWATGYNLIALPIAAGVFYNQGIILHPAVGAILMSISTIIVAINARMLRL